MTYRDELTALQAQNEVLREELADKEEAIARLETTSEPSKIEVLHERRRALERLVDEQDAAIARLEAELGRELSQPDGPEAVRIEGSKRQSIAMGVFAVLALVGAIWMVAALGEAGGTPFLMCLVLAAGLGAFALYTARPSFVVMNAEGLVVCRHGQQTHWDWADIEDLRVVINESYCSLSVRQRRTRGRGDWQVHKVGLMSTKAIAELQSASDQWRDQARHQRRRKTPSPKQ